MDNYYKQFLDLQSKLRKSEEERILLEIKFSEILREAREEHHYHYRKMASRYKAFLQEDRQRQERNENIIRSLERIESRVAMLMAKTDRFNVLRHQYQGFFSQIKEKYPDKPQVQTKTTFDQAEVPDLFRSRMDASQITEKKFNDLIQRLEKGPDYNIPERSSEKIFVAPSKSEEPIPNRYSEILRVEPVIKPDLLKPEVELFDVEPKAQKLPPKEIEEFVNKPLVQPENFVRTKRDTLEDTDQIIIKADQQNMDGLTHEDNFNESYDQVDQKTENPNAEVPIQQFTNEEAALQDSNQVIQNKTGPNVMAEPFEEEKVCFPEGIQQFQQPKGSDQNYNEAPLKYDEPEEVADPNYTQGEDQSQIVQDFKDEETAQPQQYQEPNKIDQEKNDSELNNDQKFEVKDEQGQSIEENIDSNQIIQSYNEPEQPIEQYDENGQIIQQDDPSTQQYDGLAQEYDPSVQEYDPSAPQYEPTVQYDETGQPIQQYEDGGQNYDASAQQYDEAGQPIQQYEDPSQNYDASAQLYDKAGQPIQQYEDPSQNYNSSAQQFDEAGQPIQQYEDPSQNYNPSAQQYDEAGQPIQQYEDPSQNYDASAQQYDEAGQPIQQYEDPSQNYDASAQLYDEAGQPIQYDENGQPLQQYDENGQYVQQYDENGQPLQYDQNGQPLQQYDENGQLLQQYDENGQFIQDPNATEELLEANQEEEPVVQAQPLTKPQILDILDTDTESLAQDTKVSNESDFDISNG